MRADAGLKLGKLRARLESPYVWLGLLLCCVVGAMVWLGTGCGGWDVREPLMRNAPEVDEAIARMDAGDYTRAAELLQDYLGTGKCAEGEMGVPPRIRERPDGTFDLGLVLFGIGEKFGERFGEEDKPAEGTVEPAEIDEQRDHAINCALSVVQAIAGDPGVPGELRARAHYLAGNLSFLRREYEKAVEAYDQALQIVPGIDEDADGDQIGRDAAWNRAIALRRLQEQPDAGEPDAEPDGGGDGEQGDGGGEDQQDQQDQQNQDGGGDQQQDQEQGDEEEQDAGGGDQEQQAQNEPKPKDMGSMAESGEEAPEQARMRMMLEELEDAPTYQQEEARRLRGSRARRVLEDK